MSDTVIQVRGLSKQYRLGKRQAYKTFRESIIDTLSAPFKSFRKAPLDDTNSFWALKDVNFDIKQGEVVGVIGRNGAGKSTLLKILSRITEPTEGEIDITGRIGSLLEVGTGFHPELTGRENIYLNGAILGMRRVEVKKKFDEIVAFAETEKFLDTPVKHYSSGMYTRLAFAVAAHLEPEILIVDEVLAVGDAAFQKKCLGKMKDVAGHGRTVLFVSHNMAAITSLCNRAVLLKRGTVEMDGTPERVAAEYWRAIYDQNNNLNVNASSRPGSGKLRITNVWFENSAGTAIDHAPSGDEIHLCVDYEVSESAPNVVLIVTAYDQAGNALFNLNSAWQGVELPANRMGVHTIRCQISLLPLRPGSYRLNSALAEFGRDLLDHVEGAATLEVVEGPRYTAGGVRDFEVGSFRVDAHWRVERSSASGAHNG